jgi:hypothetical protein
MPCMAQPAPRATGALQSSLLRDPVAPILALAAIFDAISGNPIHSILLFGAAAALVRESFIARREPSLEHDPLILPAPPMWILVMTAVLYAVLIGEFGRYSWPATVGVTAVAGVGILLAWRGPLHPPQAAPEIRRAGGIAWASVFVTLGLWELTQLLLQPSLTTDSWAHPTISVLSDPVLGGDIGRTVVLFLWLAVGWFLVTA